MKKKSIIKNVIIGLFAGIICGLFASGGGLILVPAFSLINKMDEKESRATSIFCILPLVITSGIIYFNNNFIDWNVGIKCAIGGIIGGVIGSFLLKRIDNKFLKITFIIFLIIVVVKMGIDIW